MITHTHNANMYIVNVFNAPFKSYSCTLLKNGQKIVTATVHDQLAKSVNIYIYTHSDRHARVAISAQTWSNFWGVNGPTQ